MRRWQSHIKLIITLVNASKWQFAFWDCSEVSRGWAVMEALPAFLSAQPLPHLPPPLHLSPPLLSAAIPQRAMPSHESAVRFPPKFMQRLRLFHFFANNFQRIWLNMNLAKLNTDPFSFTMRKCKWISPSAKKWLLKSSSRLSSIRQQQKVYQLAMTSSKF